MKINFEFENLTELEELFDSVCDIPDSIEEDILYSGTPLKETWALYEVIKRLEVKLLNEKAKRRELWKHGLNNTILARWNIRAFYIKIIVFFINNMLSLLYENK